MIEKYEIFNEKYKEIEGYLTFDTETEKYTMKILDNYENKHPDIFFSELNEQGITDVPEHLVNMWVEGRVFPPNRQGLQGMLESIGMTEYNVHDIMIYCNGRCDMDFSCLRRIN
jgi:hypothetical protein